jgi:hypothetical protein
MPGSRYIDDDTTTGAPSGEKTTLAGTEYFAISGNQVAAISTVLKYTLQKLSTTTSVDMKTAGATTLYTVPAGKTAYIMMVVIRDNSASLAGGTNYDFTGWRQSVDLSGMTTDNTTYRVLYATDNTSYTEAAAASTFQITVSTGATAAGTATIDVFGFLV